MVTISRRSKCIQIYSHRSRYFSITVTNVALGTAPMIVSFFSPFLKINTVGMLRIPYSDAILWLSSVFSFRHRNLPAYCTASSSTNGAIIRHGPHQGAQKSTSTGTSDSNTSSFHVLSVTAPAAGKHKKRKETKI